MLRLALLLFSVIATTLMGAGIVGVLAAGLDTWQPIVAAAVVGFVVSVPVSWFVARALYT